MTHYAVLRHGFDIQRNPARLGGNHDETFWLKLGHEGPPPSWLIGGVLWLVSWEGTVKMRHMLQGWYTVDRVGKCNAVIAQHCAAGNEGVIYPNALGPLDMQPWFLKFVETHKDFRDGEPTELGACLDDLLTYVRNAGCPLPPADASVGQASATG